MYIYIHIYMYIIGEMECRNEGEGPPNPRASGCTVVRCYETSLHVHESRHTLIKESCPTHEWVMTQIHIDTLVGCRETSCHVPHMHELWHTHLNESWLKYICTQLSGAVTHHFMSHILMSHIPQMNESWHTCEWVMCNTWRSHGTHVTEPWPMDESWHIHIYVQLSGEDREHARDKDKERKTRGCREDSCKSQTHTHTYTHTHTRTHTHKHTHTGTLTTHTGTHTQSISSWCKREQIPKLQKFNMIFLCPCHTHTHVSGSHTVWYHLHITHVTYLNAPQHWRTVVLHLEMIHVTCCMYQSVSGTYKRGTHE